MDKVEFSPTKGYEVINDNLGSGSFGKTILIKDPSIDELFVCKKYSPQTGIPKKDFFATFKKEIKLMYLINHPNVVRVFTYYLYEEACTGYIIMEYIDGMNIDEWFDSLEYMLGDVDCNNTFRQLIQAFACIESSGIIHRDIRESNILVTKAGIVKVIDFGLGKNFSETKMSVDSFNSLINRGQMERLPNEFSEQKYTSKTDMFCVAELYWRLIKKHKITDFQHDYILQKMMSPDPAKRYNSFSDILIALDKKDFKQLAISDEDKEIYNSFVSSLLNIIADYSEQAQLESNISKILEGLSAVIENNCLNYKIENTEQLIQVFVKNRCSYYPSKQFDTEVLTVFYEWFAEKDESYQKIVIQNINNRLIKIKVEEPLPF